MDARNWSAVIPARYLYIDMMKSMNEKFDVFFKAIMAMAYSPRGDMMSEMETILLQTLSQESPRYNLVVGVKLKRCEGGLSRNGKGDMVDAGLTLSVLNVSGMTPTALATRNTKDTELNDVELCVHADPSPC